MFLYLVRHGDAISEIKGPSSSKPLSERGRAEVDRVASHMSACCPARICYSNKLRARETAGIFSSHMAANTRAEEADGLSPDDDPAVWAGRLEGQKEDLMLVGHLPHMAQLASLLVSGSKEGAAFDFSTATVLCLLRHSNRWWIQWMLRPDML